MSMIPTDESPPPDRERSPIRITLTASILMSLIAAFVPAAVTWGTYKNRIENLERESRENRDDTKEIRGLVIAIERKLATTDAQYSEILRRLERIDRKVDSPDR